MSRQDVTIATPDGDARAFVFMPEGGAGPWPAALIYTDAFSIRPAFFEIAQRLASNGYYVLLPDMFWRLGPYPPMDPKETLADPAKKQELFGKYIGSTDAEKAMSDTGAFLAWLERQPQADAAKVAVTGYCLGGVFALRAAANFPQRVAAAAAFHPGVVVADDPDSPHRRARDIKAKVLVAGADEDSHFTEAHCATLQAALADAGVEAEVVIYRGARHGYVPRDMPVHNPEACERHWRDMLALFNGALKAGVAARAGQPQSSGRPG